MMLTALNVTLTPYGPTVTPVTVSHTGLETVVMSKPTVDHATPSVSDVPDKDQTNVLSALITPLAMLTDTVSVTLSGMEMTVPYGPVSVTQSVALATAHSTATVMSAYQMPPGENSTPVSVWKTGQVMTVAHGEETASTPVTPVTEVRHATVTCALKTLIMMSSTTEPVSVTTTGSTTDVLTGWDHVTQSVMDVLVQIAVTVSTVYITLTK